MSEHDGPLPLLPSVQAFLQEPVFAHLATLDEDGSPRVSTMWVDHDGTHIILNSPLESAKVENVRRDPRVAMDIVPQGYPSTALWIKGRVVALVTDQAQEQLERMSWKYRGQSNKVRHVEQCRVLLVVVPEEMNGAGLEGVATPDAVNKVRRPGVS